MSTTLKILAVAGVAGWMLFGNHEAQAQIPVTDPVRDKPRRSGRGRIARTA
jgi:hypothetical protein